MGAAMLQFIRTTLAGGFLFLLPIGIIALFLGKIISVTREVVEPVSKQLPFEAVAGVRSTILLAIVLIVVLSFLAGFLAKTQLARLVTKQLEDKLLSRIPAYGLIKSMSADLVGNEDATRHPVVIVDFDDARQLAIKMGEAAGGQDVIVFVPDSPTPQTGSVLIVEARRVSMTDIPVSRAFMALSSRGVGLGEQL
jgi:uncharacterized membrane protein